MGVNQVIINTENGKETIMDISEDTVTPETLAEGTTAHNAAGDPIVGLLPKVNIVQETGSSEVDVMSQAAVTNALNNLSNEKVDQSAIVQTTGDSTTAVMSQKAVTYALANVTQQKPEFAENLEWLDENGDHSKLYVLPDGYIYAWVTREEFVRTNEFSPATAKLNYKINSSATETAQTGALLLPMIAVSMENPYIVNITGVTLQVTYSTYLHITYFDDAGTRLGAKTFTSPSAFKVFEAGNYSLDIYNSSYPAATKVRIWLGIGGENAITADTVADMFVEFVPKSVTGVVSGFVSTGLPFVSSDYEDRIAGIEKKTKILNGLEGKKIVYDGDSIFAYGYSAAPIAEITGGTYENQAASSGWLSATTEKHSVVNNLANLPMDGDLYCFEGGINDYWNDVPIGSVSSSYTGTLDTSTICGALETIFRYAQNNFVGKPICFVIVHKISNTATAQNNNGDTFTDYHDAMIQVCEKYSIPYYDAFMHSGLNVNIEAHKTAFCPDLVHPNDEGHKRYYVPQMLNLFREIMPNV